MVRGGVSVFGACMYQNGGSLFMGYNMSFFAKTFFYVSKNPIETLMWIVKTFSQAKSLRFIQNMYSNKWSYCVDDRSI